jgi:hypothetical protein
LTPAARGQALDQDLPAEEEGRSGKKPKGDPAVTCRGLERLLDELVGDCADENSGAERHDQADVAARQ